MGSSTEDKAIPQYFKLLKSFAELQFKVPFAILH